MDIQQALGKAIKTVRTSKDLSQEYFSDISSRTYLSVLENGKKKPSVDKIDSIAKAMGVHPLTLFTLAYMNLNGEHNLTDIQNVVSNQITEALASKNVTF